MANVGVQNCQHHANRIASINSYRMGLHGKNHPILRAGSSYIPWSSHGNLWKSPEKNIEFPWNHMKQNYIYLVHYPLDIYFPIYSHCINQFSQHFSWSNPLFCVGYPTVLDHVPGETIWFPHLWIHLNTGESQKKTNTLGQPWLGGLCSPFFLLGRKKMDNHHYQNMWTHVDYQRLTRYKWISP